VSTLFEILLAVAAMWFVWRFLNALLHPRRPVDPVDDPDASVLAPRKKPPQAKSGAVALEEPEDDDSVNGFPPRTL
jgi:hypothetical protein